MAPTNPKKLQFFMTNERRVYELKCIEFVERLARSALPDDDLERYMEEAYDLVMQSKFPK